MSARYADAAIGRARPLAILALVMGGCGSAGSADAPPERPSVTAAPVTRTAAAPIISTPATAAVARPVMTLSQAIGQRLVTGFQGPSPSADIVRAIRDGAIGGVILFADNLRGVDGARRLVSRLQRVARRAGRPPLFVMIDQEGGTVRRLPTAPPTESPAGMGVAPNVGDVARAQGRSTARVLRAAGFNVDLAPVADVPFDDSSFLGTRAFGMRPSIVARGACGFAAGLRRGGIAATLKHFPGLGRARTNTDQQPTTILASAASLLRDLAAYRRCGDSVALVMLSSAVYPALDPSNPAVLSPAAHGLLESVGFTGLTITDAFDTPAIAARRRAATRAIRAGVDLLLYGQSGRTALAAHDRLVAEARAGRLGHANLIATATRIVAFKHRLTRGRP